MKYLSAVREAVKLPEKEQENLFEMEGKKSELSDVEKRQAENAGEYKTKQS